VLLLFWGLLEVGDAREFVLLVTLLAMVVQTHVLYLLLVLTDVVESYGLVLFFYQIQGTLRL